MKDKSSRFLLHIQAAAKKMTQHIKRDYAVMPAYFRLKFY